MATEPIISVKGRVVAEREDLLLGHTYQIIDKGGFIDKFEREQRSVILIAPGARKRARQYAFHWRIAEQKLLALSDTRTMLKRCHLDHLIPWVEQVCEEFWPFTTDLP